MKNRITRRDILSTIFSVGVVGLGGCKSNDDTVESVQNGTPKNKTQFTTDVPTTDVSSNLNTDTKEKTDYEFTDTLDKTSKPLSVSGSWRQYLGDSGNSNSDESVNGVPDSGVGYWKQPDAGFPPVFSDKKIYSEVLHEPQNVTVASLKSETGDVNWYGPDKIGVAGLAIYKNSLIVLSNELYSFDLIDGTMNWDIDYPGWVPSGPPKFDDGYLYFSTGVQYGTRSIIIGVELRNGQIEWWSELDQGQHITSSLAVNSNKLVAGTRSNQIIAFERENGNRSWSYSTSEKVETHPVIVRDTVYAVDKSGEIYAINLRNGELRWQVSSSSPSGGIACASNELYYGSVEGVHNIDCSSQSEKWFYPTNRPPTTPTVDNSTVYTGTAGRDRRFYAIDKDSGEKRWSFKFPSFFLKIYLRAVYGTRLFLSMVASLFKQTMHFMHSGRGMNRVRQNQIKKNIIYITIFPRK